uniref:C2H2-type domain-containing protein n=1 Tax=Meloidogyne hapla TaxID=6305 RepID=A0A1I8BMX2_MELHA
MEEESTSDDPLTLNRPTTSFISFPQKYSSSPSSEITSEFNNLIDEFVDLSEWGALSDGDLCMSRQLAATIGLQNGREEEEVIEERKEMMNIEAKKEENGENEEEDEEDEYEEEVGFKINGINKVERQNGNSNNSVGEWCAYTEQNIKYENNNNINGNYLNNGNNNVVADRVTENELVYLHQNIQNEASSSSPSSFLPVSDQSPLAPPPPPIVISPQEVDNITITLEKNQQCACSECGKLFNSVWYLKQKKYFKHAVKHSNDRPFKCRFCMKTYKFRSNLYQHKCPERNRLLVAGEFNMIGHPYRRRAYTRSADKKKLKELKEHKLQMMQNQKQDLANDKQLNGASHQQSPNHAISINTTTTTSSMFTKDEFHSPQHLVGQQIYPTKIEREENGLLMGNEPGKNGNQTGNYSNYLGQQGMMYMSNTSDCCAQSFNTNLNSNIKTSFIGELNGQYHSEDNVFIDKNEKMEENRTLSTEVLEEYLHKNRHRHLPFFVNPIDQFSFVGSDLNEYTGQSDNEEESSEDYQPQQSSHFELNSSNKNDVGLSRKTTQDSGYHGSDTHSPAGSHSPIDDGSGSFASSSHSFDHNQKVSVKSDFGSYASAGEAYQSTNYTESPVKNGRTGKQ